MNMSVLKFIEVINSMKNIERKSLHRKCSRDRKHFVFVERRSPLILTILDVQFFAADEPEHVVVSSIVVLVLTTTKQHEDVIYN